MATKSTTAAQQPAYGSLEYYTESSVARLLSTFKVAEDNKENDVPTRAPTKASAKHAALRSKILVERKAKARSPPQITARKATANPGQRQLATRIVNDTLKILSAAIKNSGDEPKPATDSRAPTKSAADASIKRLRAVASCATAAFCYLRGHDESDAIPTQLETGVLALSTKLLALGLLAEARKELNDLRRRVQSVLTPTIEDVTGPSRLAVPFIRVDPGQLDSASTKLISNHAVLILQLLGKSAQPITLDVLSVLDPLSKDGPFAVIVQHASQVPDGKTLDGDVQRYLQLIKSWRRHVEQQTKVEPEIWLHLEVLPVRAQQQCPRIDQEHSTSEDLLTTLVSHVRSYRSRSSLQTLDQYTFVDDMLSRMLAHELPLDISKSDSNAFNKLCSLMGQLAAAAGLSDQAQQWSSRSSAAIADNELLSAIAALRSQSPPTTYALRQLSSALQPYEDLLLCDMVDSTVLDAITKKCLEVATKPAFLPNIAVPMHELVCLLVSVHSRQSDIHDHNGISKGILQAGIFMCSYVLRHGVQPSRTLLSTLEGLHNISGFIDKTSNGQTLTALSNLEEKAAHACAQGSEKATLLLNSVSSIISLGLGQMQVSCFLPKVIAAVTACYESGSFASADACIKMAFQHLCDTGWLDKLVADLDHQSLEVLMGSDSEMNGVIELMSLVRHIGHGRRQPMFMELTQSLPSRHVWSYLWLMLPYGSAEGFNTDDFDACRSNVEEHFPEAEYPIRAQLISQRAHILSPATTLLVARSSRTSSHRPGHDRGLQGYQESTSLMGRLVCAVCSIDTDFDDINAVLTSLNECIGDISSPKALSERFYDLTTAVSVLLQAAERLLDQSLIDLSSVAVHICQRLLALTKQPEDREQRLLLLQARLDMEYGGIETASERTEKLSKILASISPASRMFKDVSSMRLATACALRQSDTIPTVIKAFLESQDVRGMSRQQKAEKYASFADHLVILAKHRYDVGFMEGAAHLARRALLTYRSLLTPSTGTRTASARASPLGALDDLPDLTSSEGSESEKVVYHSPDLAYKIVTSLLLLHSIHAATGLRIEAEYHLDQAFQTCQQLPGAILEQRLRIAALVFDVTAGLRSMIQPAKLESKAPVCNVKGNTIMFAEMLLASGKWQTCFDQPQAGLQIYDAAVLALRIASELDREESPKANPVAFARTRQIKGPKVSTKRPAGPEARSRTAVMRRPQGDAPPSVGIKTSQNLCQKSPFGQALLRRIELERSLTLFQVNELRRTTEPFDETFLTASTTDSPQAVSTWCRINLAHVRQLLQTDVRFSSLSESTVSISACNHADRQTFGTEIEEQLAALNISESDSRTQIITTSAARVAAQLVIAAKGRYDYAINFQLASLALESSILLSALAPGNGLHQHPMFVAWAMELPEILAHDKILRQLALERDNGDRTPSECLQNAQLLEEDETGYDVTTFQQDFIDLIPEQWTTVSITMNEDCTELWIGRYRSGTTPFFLRIPMSRSEEAGLDLESIFTFARAKREMEDIIRESDHTCHHPPDAKVKGAKTQWWSQRESLDDRLRELLTNMEMNWFGGFRGIFALSRPDVETLARFRKSFEAILARHLPSRTSRKSGTHAASLHSHVLGLFVALGGQEDEAEHFDEDVADLLYYVIDLLQWNGEANAVDEIDLDAMAAETGDAIRAYHSAMGVAQTRDRHLILRLDRRLHRLPWESMPCLQGVSISRVGSMLQLRERLLLLPRNKRFAAARQQGTYILNPSSDLIRTEGVLGPLLQPLAAEAGWTSHVRTRLDDKIFAAALAECPITLYFGHGSGTQYIRESTIRKLQRCSEVVWLMGCSSGAVTENGNLRSTSVPLSYLLAGTGSGGDRSRKGVCLAVVATLWDVTDKDIDAFSVSVGEKWGLFALAATKKKEETMAPPKTPGRKPRTAPKTPRGGARATAKTPRRNAKTKTVEEDPDTGSAGSGSRTSMSLTEAVARSRDKCYLRYLNGAASVVYGVPVHLAEA